MISKLANGMTTPFEAIVLVFIPCSLIHLICQLDDLSIC
jgi:hypothetical protein